jgi:dihydroorotase
VFDLGKSYKVDPAEFCSMGRATPFEGDTLWGRCLLTLCAGEAVWKEKGL